MSLNGRQGSDTRCKRKFKKDTLFFIKKFFHTKIAKINVSVNALKLILGVLLKKIKFLFYSKLKNYPVFYCSSQEDGLKNMKNLYSL